MIRNGREKENSTECSVCAAYTLRSTGNDEHIFTCISRRTTDQSLPAAPCPAAGTQSRPIKWPKILEADSTGFWTAGESEEILWTLLQQWTAPELQFRSSPDVVGTATTAVMKVTIERNLECIVVMLRETVNQVKRFEGAELRNLHPRDEA